MFLNWRTRNNGGFILFLRSLLQNTVLVDDKKQILIGRDKYLYHKSIHHQSELLKINIARMHTISFIKGKPATALECATESIINSTK